MATFWKIYFLGKEAREKRGIDTMGIESTNASGKKND